TRRRLLVVAGVDAKNPTGKPSRSATAGVRVVAADGHGSGLGSSAARAFLGAVGRDSEQCAHTVRRHARSDSWFLPPCGGFPLAFANSVTVAFQAGHIVNGITRVDRENQIGLER